MSSGDPNGSLLPRAILYRVLALALYEPSQALYEVLESEDISADLAAAAEALLGTEGQGEALKLLDAYQEAKAQGERGILDLHAEYNRLFVGPFAVACSPYQSVYDTNRPSDDLGTIMGPTAEAVEKAMREEGMGLTLDHTIIADHAAVELEFMFYLLSRSMENAEQAARYLDRSLEFKRAHIVSWQGPFAACMTKEAKHPFYQHAGRLLQLFVQAEGTAA